MAAMSSPAITATTTLADLGEFGLIAELSRRFAQGDHVLTRQPRS